MFYISKRSEKLKDIFKQDIPFQYIGIWCHEIDLTRIVAEDAKVNDVALGSLVAVYCQ